MFSGGIPPSSIGYVLPKVCLMIANHEFLEQSHDYYKRGVRRWSRELVLHSLCKLLLAMFKNFRYRFDSPELNLASYGMASGCNPM